MTSAKYTTLIENSRQCVTILANTDLPDGGQCIQVVIFTSYIRRILV